MNLPFRCKGVCVCRWKHPDCTDSLWLCCVKAFQKGGRGFCNRQATMIGKPMCTSSAGLIPAHFGFVLGSCSYGSVCSSLEDAVPPLALVPGLLLFWRLFFYQENICTWILSFLVVKSVLVEKEKCLEQAKKRNLLLLWLGWLQFLCGCVLQPCPGFKSGRPQPSMGF